MIDLGDFIELEATQFPVVLVPKTIGGYDNDGKWIEGPGVPINIKAVIQPAKDGEQLIDERNGSRSEIKLNLWTRTTINVDDKVTYRGSDYRVMKVLDRLEGGFFKASLGMLP